MKYLKKSNASVLCLILVKNHKNFFTSTPQISLWLPSPLLKIKTGWLVVKLSIEFELA